jgi:hypothetical protein
MLVELGAEAPENSALAHKAGQVSHKLNNLDRILVQNAVH